jgi:hypothetical protein
VQTGKAGQAVQSFGNLKTARILVIGHDPTLQNSDAQAEYAFFLEWLDRQPTVRAEASQRRFALRLLEYMDWLAGRNVPLSDLYVTNLCNDFLNRQGKGVIYIPEAKASAGIKALESLVDQANFKVILPMAEQAFYWLCKLGFIDGPDRRVDAYLAQAEPQSEWAANGLYRKLSGTPFVEVCGRKFYHRGVPVVPIMHLNGWQRKLSIRWQKYVPGMRRARSAVRHLLRELPA